MKMYFSTTILVFICFLSLVFSVSSVSPDISAGQNHVLAIKENGEVWVGGANNEEQLGQPSGEHFPAAPLKFHFLMGRTGIQLATDHAGSIKLKATKYLI